MPTTRTVSTADVVAIGAAGRHRRARIWAALAVGAALFALSYADGGYGTSSRSLLGVCLWWSIILGVALGLLPRAPFTKAVRGIAALLAVFALWTLLSMVWAPSPELAFDEFNRASLYLALFLLVAATGGRRNTGWWMDGLRLGILAVVLVSLGSRLFPQIFPTRNIATFLPNAATRLSFPIGYWNGLAILAALVLPLLFADAVAARVPARRAGALAAVPFVAAVIVLASSRGGVIAAVVGSLVFWVSSDRRWRAAVVVAIGAVSSAIAYAALRSQDTLVNGPLGGDAARRQGVLVALLLVAVAVLTAMGLVVAERLWGERPSPSRATGRALVLAGCALVLVAAILVHPVRRFDDFRRIPTPTAAAPDFATAHLLSGSSSGRWQFWAAAIDQWKSAPLLGGGAGSYRFWWSEHASFPYSLRNAHSLYLEVLGELGLVGFFLLVGALAWGLATGVRGLPLLLGPERQDLAALLGVLCAFLVSAGIDWVWQLTAVGAVGVAALALVAGSGGSPVIADVARTARHRLAFGAAAVAGAWVAICAQVVPWVTESRIADSQAAARRGDLAHALAAARDARAIQPWAASPYVQMALVAEEQNDLTSAVRWIHAATRRDDENWATWFVAARLERKAGHADAARRAFARARTLNIRSPLFANTSGS